MKFFFDSFSGNFSIVFFRLINSDSFYSILYSAKRLGKKQSLLILYLRSPSIVRYHNISRSVKASFEKRLKAPEVILMPVEKLKAVKAVCEHNLLKRHLKVREPVKNLPTGLLVSMHFRIIKFKEQNSKIKKCNSQRKNKIKTGIE